MDNLQRAESDRGQGLIAGRLSDDNLVAVLQQRSQGVSALEALKELNRRRSSQASPLTISILTDTAHSPELRAVAAVALGKQSAPGHQEALLAALTSPDPSVVRRSAEALGRIGDPQTLDALARLHPTSTVAQRSVTFAQTLLSHRHGLHRSLLKPPPKSSMLHLQPEAAHRLEMQPVAVDQIDQMSGELRRLLPEIPVSQDGGLAFSCGENRFLCLLTQAMHDWPNLSALKDRDAVMAVVLKRSQAMHVYTLYAYILTKPAKASSVCVFGVRPSGILTHYGSAQVQDGGMNVTLESLNTTHSPALKLELVYDHQPRKLNVTSALIQSQPAPGQLLAKRPNRLRLPLRR
jgi:hypothetical protein